MDLRLVPDAAGRNLVFSNASFRVDNLKTVTVQKDGSGSLVTGMVEKEVKQKRAAANVVINDSLYASANRAGIPDRVVSNAIRLFSYSIDFQRDIKRGDRMEVLYDSFQTAEGDTVKTGDIIYARMILGGKEYPLYRYEGRDGSADYYTPEGKSLKRSATLMKTPIDGARMSSGFGVRRHPVLGYTKMHKGVDFAAPTGTPIYAAGNGTIERAGRFSSYGNYVRIRHNAKLSTAYAHVSRYASGIRPGVKVKQGQVIAYVGTTGRSTGPHLHFEVMVNGVQVNPRNLKLPESNALQGEELRRFKNSIRNFDQQYVELTSAVKLASAE
jgi:murein DD-endopeptidase MepM/ murein hydrolase activator NlpD